MESLHFKTVRSNRHAEEKNCVLLPAHKEICHKERGGDDRPPPLSLLSMLTLMQEM